MERINIPTIISVSTSKPIKCSTVEDSIEGPMETADGQLYFKLLLKEDIQENYISLSKYMIKHIFEKTHPIAFKECMDIMNNNFTRPLRLKLEQRLYKTMETLTEIQHLESENIQTETQYFHTLAFEDERLETPLIIETIMQELKFKPIKINKKTTTK